MEAQPRFNTAYELPRNRKGKKKEVEEGAPLPAGVARSGDFPKT
jgi:hypothetical protein